MCSAVAVLDSEDGSADDSSIILRYVYRCILRHHLIDTILHTQEIKEKVLTILHTEGSSCKST